MRIVVGILAAFLVLFGVGLFVEVPLLSPAANALAGILKWIGITALILLLLGVRKWSLRIIVIIALAALAVGLMFEIPYLSPAAHFLGGGLGWLMKWVSVVCFALILIGFVVMEIIKERRRAKDGGKVPDKKGSSAPVKPAAKSNWKEKVPWLKIAIGLVVLYFVYRLIEAIAAGNGAHPPHPGHVPSPVTVSSTTPVEPVKTISCGASESDPVKFTVPAQGLSDLIENPVSDELVASVTYDAPSDALTMLAGSQKRECGAGTAGTERFCFRNVTDKPVEARCYYSPKP